MSLFVDLRRPKFAVLHDGTAGMAGGNPQPQSAVQRTENCSEDEGAGPSVASRTLFDRLLRQIAYQVNFRDPLVVGGAVLSMALLGIAASAIRAGARRRSVQTHARRVKQDGFQQRYQADALIEPLTERLGHSDRFVAEPRLTLGEGIHGFLVIC